jgi:nucleotide-binding universal stress UspA family protein
VAEWVVLEERSPLGFVDMARCSDLVVFPNAGMKTPRLTAVDLARDAAAPLLLTPASPLSMEVGRKVLVAWNGSRQAANALHGAWPILEEAERVHVVMVDPPAHAEAFIGKYLKRHSVDAQIHIDRSAEANAGEVIRREAERRGVDLVVMGLYGHARLRELMLGGASGTMLEQESFPLLVSR